MPKIGGTVTDDFGNHDLSNSVGSVDNTFSEVNNATYMTGSMFDQ